MFNKILGLFNKVNSGVNMANQMQNTVNYAGYQKSNLDAAKSRGKGYMYIIIAIIVVAILYVIFG